MKSAQTFCIKTYGCQMNELDSEVMRGSLVKRGLLETDDETIADIIIFNTCSVRDLAERKVLGKLGQIVRSRNPKPIIGVAGCMASSKKEKLLEKLPHIDFVLGTNNIHSLNAVLDEALQTKKQVLCVDKKFEHELDYSLAHRKDPLKACVSIIRGCNKHCTYCIVPYTRGPEVSRHPTSIIEECSRLVQEGYKEITLLGQNVNSYGKDQPEWSFLFPDLLQKLNDIPGMSRIRFLTSHPVDISPLLMSAIRELPTVCEFVHFPLQSGSDRILQKMHRMYSKQEYFDKVALLKEYVPNVALGTDIIVGFPTETEEDFEETLACMKEIRFSTAFMFAYSPRKGTPSYRWTDDIPKDTKDQRLQRLIDMQHSIQIDHMHALLGQTVEVLVESVSTKDTGMLKGTTRTWKNIVFPGDSSFIGTLQQVVIDTYSHQTCVGTIASQTKTSTLQTRLQ